MKMRFYKLSVAFLVLLMCLSGMTVSQVQARGKILEFGYDTPTAQWLYENFQRADCVPFDGMVLNLGYRGNDGLANWLWSNVDLTGAQTSRIDADVYYLMITPFERFGTEFLFRVNSSNWNAPDVFDADFQKVIDNFTYLGGIIENTGAAGIAFDPEYYIDKHPWLYDSNQAYYSTKTLQEYKDQYRLRGGEIATAIRNVVSAPEVIFMFLFANSHSSVAASYDLLPAFIDGLLDNAGGQIRVVDGMEQAYPAKTQSDFDNLVIEFQNGALLSADPNRYLSDVNMAFGIRMDEGGFYYDPCDFNLNHRSPAEFQFTMDTASTLGTYVWLWSQSNSPTGEKNDWWDTQNIPSEYVDALYNVAQVGCPGKFGPLPPPQTQTVYIPDDYGSIDRQTLLFDPLDSSGPAILTGGANWTTASGGMYGEGVEINQNLNERVYWNTSSISTSQSQLNEGTIELYWKVPAAGVSWYSTFANMFVEDAPNGEVQIFMPNNDPNLTFQLYDSPNTTYRTLISTNTTWDPNTWYHLAFTWSASGMEIWIDGTLDASNATAAYWAIQSTTSVALGSLSTLRTPAVGIFDSLRISNVKYDYAPMPVQLTNCGEPGTVYLAADLNEDCYIDLYDFNRFAVDWMDCTDPNDPDCVGYYCP